MIKEHIIFIRSAGVPEEAIIFMFSDRYDFSNESINENKSINEKKINKNFRKPTSIPNKNIWLELESNKKSVFKGEQFSLTCYLYLRHNKVQDLQWAVDPNNPIKSNNSLMYQHDLGESQSYTQNDYFTCIKTHHIVLNPEEEGEILVNGNDLIQIRYFDNKSRRHINKTLGAEPIKINVSILPQPRPKTFLVALDQTLE